MNHKKLVVVNNHGEKLVGILHEVGSKDLVIICHGFRSSKDRIPMATLATAFEEVGISAFRFDFAGNGGSEGSFQYGNYRREADDLRVVVEHFRQSGRFIAAIVGHSKGGNVVLLYASKYGDVPVVVNIAGRYNLERGIEGRLGKNYLERIKQDGFIDVKNKRGRVEFRVTEESLMDRLTTDICTSCQSIPPNCRVLTVHGSEDEMVGMEDAFEFAKRIPTHTLHIIKGADHEFTSHQCELASIVVAFVISTLSNEEATKSSVTMKRPIHSRF